ncbi:hypothetical protein BE15_09525 [Sorangium cellulosum]|uniref:Uncharacterized protein n=1 Tax=Sorangium cellulosum TaxID=56 RepID=A0A150Q987_SORCE|nr:hypothetical protein BE15_09525 [Sorangium cellulosum]
MNRTAVANSTISSSTSSMPLTSFENRASFQCCRSRPSMDIVCGMQALVSAAAMCWAASRIACTQSPLWRTIDRLVPVREPRSRLVSVSTSTTRSSMYIRALMRMLRSSTKMSAGTGAAGE